MIILLGCQPGHQSESDMGIYAGWGGQTSFVRVLMERI